MHSHTRIVYNHSFRIYYICVCLYDIYVFFLVYINRLQKFVLFLLGTEAFFFKCLPFSFLGTEVAKICSKAGFCFFISPKSVFF